MKGNAVYKRSHNGCLSLCATLEIGAELPSENELSQALAVSRTTVRAVLGGLEEAGIVGRREGARRLLRRPEPVDRFPDPQTLSTSATVERRFLQWVLEGRVGEGQILSASDLARRFGTSTTTIREHLPQFGHFGLVERRANGTWLFKGVTPAFADEIYEVRELFELRGAHRFVTLAEESEPWRRLRAIERDHRDLQQRLDRDFAQFPGLDERLHRAIHETAGNRFVTDFYDIISMLFHYNFRWDVDDEKRRASTSLAEHLTYIEALLARDVEAAEAACRRHLRTGHANLLRSIAMRSR